jgi:hypothetical protein
MLLMTFKVLKGPGHLFNEYLTNDKYTLSRINMKHLLLFEPGVSPKVLCIKGLVPSLALLSLGGARTFRRWYQVEGS